MIKLYFISFRAIGENLCKYICPLCFQRFVFPWSWASYIIPMFNVDLLDFLILCLECNFTNCFHLLASFFEILRFNRNFFGELITAR